MRPLRFGVSAEIFGNRRAAAVVKTKSREVVNLAVKKEGETGVVPCLAQGNCKKSLGASFGPSIGLGHGGPDKVKFEVIFRLFPLMDGNQLPLAAAQDQMQSAFR